MSAFDEEQIKRILALAKGQEQQERQDWNAHSIYERLDETIIGNTQYKQSLALCIADSLKAPEIPNHLLVIGPSGSGKTYLLEQCVPEFGIPYHIVDCSALVPAGYSGNTLGESLREFFKAETTAAARAIIILDEFDKISEKANGGDVHKSHSLQSELLPLLQGKQEGVIDTRRTLWILVGAFAYADEMRQTPPKLCKCDLLKYGFKNELLGRITQLAITDIPTTEEIVRRIGKDKTLKAFISDLKEMSYEVSFSDEVILDIALEARSPDFGMRTVPALMANLKRQIIFNGGKGKVEITREMLKGIRD